MNNDAHKQVYSRVGRLTYIFQCSVGEDHWDTNLRGSEKKIIFLSSIRVVIGLLLSLINIITGNQ
jgi:hypothetical protein